MSFRSEVLRRSSLLVYWPGDGGRSGTEVDASGNGKNGTYNGTSGGRRPSPIEDPVLTTHKYAGALACNGPDVAIPTTHSIFAWWLIGDRTANQNIVGPDDTSIDQYAMLRVIGGVMQYGVRTNSDNVMNLGTAPANGSLVFLVGTCDAADGLRGYVNGVYVNSQALAAGATRTASGFDISDAIKVPAGGSVVHAGAMSRRLLDNEIRMMWRAGLTRGSRRLLRPGRR